MIHERQHIIENAFLDFISHFQHKNESQQAALDIAPIPPGSIQESLWPMLQCQLTSRILDYAARDFKKKQLCYYTISSAGHENNVALGELLLKQDMCFLHYRSGALMARRQQKLSSSTGDLKKYIDDTIRSLCASAQDPVSGGRHKVWGSFELNVPPQTSTIASHLPKAVGAAFAIDRARRLGLKNSDAIVCCSFGDASANHASSLAAFNTAQWTHYQNIALPIVFVCEDNGLGISVSTPVDWIENNFSAMPKLKYIKADALAASEVVKQSQAAIDYCRKHREPVFLHLKTTRLMGHAGSDIQGAYLSERRIAQLEDRDPLLHWSKWILQHKLCKQDDILNFYHTTKAYVHERFESIAKEKKIQNKQDLMQPYSIPSQKKIAAYENVFSSSEQVKKRQDFFGLKSLPEKAKPRHMAMLMSQALSDIMLLDDSVVTFGEDVAQKGGVYHVTKNLLDRFGPHRVFNTLLDEQSILGLAIGMAQQGFIPIPEIQYLAYYQNAQDQIRSEAASLAFFSNNQFKNPMVLRIASFAYQKGFGGHFHNDNSIAALLDIPGIMVVTPGRGDDAVALLRLSYILAKYFGQVVLFLEPIALYMTKHLHEQGDGQFLCEYPEPAKVAQILEPRSYGNENSDICIISYANGAYLSLKAIEQFKKSHGQEVQLIDLIWLQPLPLRALATKLQNSQKILIVDECREHGGIANRLYRYLNQALKKQNIQVITADNSYIPLGSAANLVLPQVEDIYEKLLEML